MGLKKQLSVFCGTMMTIHFLISAYQFMNRQKKTDVLSIKESKNPNQNWHRVGDPEDKIVTSNVLYDRKENDIGSVDYIEEDVILNIQPCQDHGRTKEGCKFIILPFSCYATGMENIEKQMLQMLQIPENKSPAKTIDVSERFFEKTSMQPQYHLKKREKD